MLPFVEYLPAIRAKNLVSLEIFGIGCTYEDPAGFRLQNSLEFIERIHVLGHDVFNRIQTYYQVKLAVVVGQVVAFGSFRAFPKRIRGESGVHCCDRLGREVQALT